MYNLIIFSMLAMNHTTITINKMEKYLFYVPGGHPIYELILRGVFETTPPHVSSSPDISILKI